LLWGISFLAERIAKGIVKIAIVATVIVGGMTAILYLPNMDIKNIAL